ncbi:bestrophin-4-like [Anastrepha obliqua]|uniref:bestrophin-4-like n=1 Tax=Anastrepha obliqua TaxID=95512 RepID=UPI00240A4C81|nr:bestrophin-4-like [Anastrepha obliqua]
MTVSYQAQVATSNFNCFLKLLARWRGSIYKIIWIDLAVFMVLYYFFGIMYRFVMGPEQKRLFELLIHYCHNSSTLIPLSFVLGFYIAVVMQRWWTQYITVPWPDPLAVYVSTLFVGQDERGRMMRRTVMRYVCLCLTMIFMMVAPSVKKRFPTMDSLVDAGLLTDNEKDVLVAMDEKSPKHRKHWVPLVWAASIVSRARKEGRIRDDVALKTIFDQLDAFRNKCAVILHFDSVPIPLVYTQVVALTVYSYFLAALIGQQWVPKEVDADGHFDWIDYYVPIFTMLQFFFYMGWLKVAESLLNPFGDDDDDFEVNWMIDRNLQVSYFIVDEMHHEHPELVKDQYWDEVLPGGLPYPDDFQRVSTNFADVGKSDGAAHFVWKRRDNMAINSSLHSSISRINSAMKRLISKDDTQTTTISPTHLSTSSNYSDDEEQTQHSTSSFHERHVITNKYSVAAPRPAAKISDRTTETAESRSSRLAVDQRRTLSSTAKSISYEEDHEESKIEKDDFDLLREERERQRQERQRQRIMQNVYTATSATADLLPALIASGLNLTTPSTLSITLQPTQQQQSEHRSGTSNAKSSSSLVDSKTASKVEAKEKRDDEDKQQK